MAQFNQNGFAQMLQGMIRQGSNNPQAFVNGFLQQNPQFAQQLQGKNVQQEAATALLRIGFPPDQVRQMFPNAQVK